MAESINSTLSLPVATSRDVLTDILRDGAQRLLAQAVEAEVAEWIDSHADLKNTDGHRQVVRNGHLPKRTITTGVGPIEVEQPRVLDRRTDERSRTFFLQDSSSLPAEDQEPGGVDPLAVPERRQHRRLQRSPDGAGGPELSRPVGLDRHTTESLLGRRIPGVESRDPWKGNSTSTCGPTACISTSAWKKIGSASWC